MNVIFQYLKPGDDSSEEMTVSDAEIDNADVIPNVGDYVLLTQTHPPEKVGVPRKFKVVSRHFSFLEHRPYDTVTLVVSDYEDCPEAACRE